jgi:hypothetical protein
MGIEPILFLTKSFPLAHNCPVTKEISFSNVLVMSFVLKKKQKNVQKFRITT